MDQLVTGSPLDGSQLGVKQWMRFPGRYIQLLIGLLGQFGLYLLVNTVKNSLNSCCGKIVLRPGNRFGPFPKIRTELRWDKIFIGFQGPPLAQQTEPIL